MGQSLYKIGTYGIFLLAYLETKKKYRFEKKKSDYVAARILSNFPKSSHHAEIGFEVITERFESFCVVYIEKLKKLTSFSNGNWTVR